VNPAPDRSHWIIRWALYGFVASIPFEIPDRSIPLEVTTITGCIFLLATWRQPLRCFGRVPGALWAFGAFLYVFWVSFVLGGGGYLGDALKSFAAFLQLLLIFWAAFNVLREDTVATRALLAFGISCVLLGLLTVGGVMHMDSDWVSESGRETMFGQNANRAGLTLASGALALVGLTYGRDRQLIRPRWLVWPLVVVIALAIVKGGSRGSMLAFIIGLWTFTVAGRTIEMKLKNTVVATVAVVVLGWAAWQSPLVQARFEKAENLNLAGREEIFPIAGRMFLEKPLWGWGPAQNKYEIASRLPPLEGFTRRDSHNLVLEVVTSTGLLGAVPFFLGTGLCLWGAWKARRGIYGVMPVAMAATMMAANMAGNYIAFKLYWVVLALGAAAGSLMPRRPAVRARWAARGIPAC